MKILIATDGSACSDAAVREAAVRTWPAGSVLRVVSVIDLNLSGAPVFTPVDPDSFGEVERALRATAEAIVGRAKERLADAGTPGLVVETGVLLGPPAPTIRDEAESWGADLVIVGSHGRGVMGRLLLGSVSMSVALHATCSVEIVRDRVGALRAA